MHIRRLGLVIVAALVAGCSGTTRTPVPLESSSSPPSPGPTDAGPTPLPTTAAQVVLPAAGQTATLLANGKVLVAGGLGTGTADGPTAAAELYDPVNGTWTGTGAMGTPRFGHTAVLLASGRVLVAGGGSGPAEAYDPTSGTWAAVSGMPSVDGQTTTMLSDRRLLVVGCCGGFALFDPAIGSTTATGPMAQERGNSPTATVLRDGKVLVAGGGAFEGCSVAVAELFDPELGTWTATGEMTTSRIAHSATLLQDGRVLVVGGLGGLDCFTLASAEIYDPQRGTWTATGSLGVAGGLSDFTATLLPSGKVLVLGGVTGASSTAVTSAELYDPATGAWTPMPSLTIPRTGHTATLLPNGRVLVVGGSPGDKSGPTAELYDPSAAP